MIKKIIIFSFALFTHIASASEQKYSIIELENEVVKHTKEKNAQNNLRKNFLKDNSIRSALLKYYEDLATTEKQINPMERFRNVSNFGNYIVQLEHQLFPSELFVDDYQEFKDHFFKILRSKNNSVS